MYSQIDANKRKTWVLVTLFSVLIMLIFVGFGAYMGADIVPSIITGFIVSVLYSLFAFYASSKTVLLTHRAKEVNKENARDLYVMVENLAITAGLPMPKVYIIDDPSLNAFATGRDPKHAAVTFTRGILGALNKQELEGVIAHELSHIKNYDIRVMTLVVVLVGLVVLLSDIMLRVGMRSGGRKNVPWPAILIAIALALLSPLIAQLIKLAVSRAREYLADASGSLLTRHPDGLASALEKLRANNQPLKSANHATAHLFIASPFGEKTKSSKKWYQRLFATHPPIDDRITKLRGMGS